MTTALIVALLVGAIWMGFSVPLGGVSALIAAAFGIVFFLGALLLYGTQCDGVGISDILLFRAPVGTIVCSGKLTFLAYATFLAGLIVLARTRAKRRKASKER
jgi:hypothetical protein